MRGTGKRGRGQHRAASCRQAALAQVVAVDFGRETAVLKAGDNLRIVHFIPAR